MAVEQAVVEHRAYLAIQALSRRVEVAGAYLFGSHVDGRADEYSDIDVGAFVEGLEKVGYGARGRHQRRGPRGSRP